MYINCVSTATESSLVYGYVFGKTVSIWRASGVLRNSIVNGLVHLTYLYKSPNSLRAEKQTLFSREKNKAEVIYSLK